MRFGVLLFDHLSESWSVGLWGYWNCSREQMPVVAAAISGEESMSR